MLEVLTLFYFRILSNLKFLVQDKTIRFMKQFLLITVCIILLAKAPAQVITNIVYVGEKGITENIKEANAFIMIKSMGAGRFERSDYKIHGPLQSVQTYSDSTLTILDGNNLTYSPEGKLGIAGYYTNNKRDREWYYYNDTFKVIRKDVYKDGNLVETIIDDTTRHRDTLVSGEKEATFPGGRPAWFNYLTSTLNPNVAISSVKGGSVLVRFVINKEGQVADIYLRKSVEFVLDEEALRVIHKMPKWEPAVQNGRNVNAYRVQPITFVKSE